MNVFPKSWGIPIAHKTFNTLGIWLGFDHPLSLKREGIARFLFYLVKHLLKNYPLRCEIWCYEFNYKEIKELFGEMVGVAKYADRLKIFTENTFQGAKRTRLSVFREGIGIAREIFLCGTNASWTLPYLNYRLYFGKPSRRTSRGVNSSLDRDSVPRYLPIDLSLSVILILAGFLSRGVRKVIFKKRLFPKVVRTRLFEAAGLPSYTGQVVGSSRVAEEGRDKPGNIVYGPYLKLSPGYHEVRVFYSWSVGNGKGANRAFWDISFNCGNDVIAHGELSEGDGRILRREFWVEKRYNNTPMEIRIWYGGCGRLEVKRIEVLRGRESKDTLAVLANEYSQADCMLIPIVTLYNALDIRRSKIITIHDLAPLVYYDYFHQEIAMDESRRNEIKDHLRKFSMQGCFFCSNSDYVRRHHALPYIPDTSVENTGFVYLPLNVPENINNRILDRKALFIKYSIGERYIFYPTQLRPYKNVISLLKALKILIAKHIKIQLVLTGQLIQLPSAHRYVHENHLQSYIVLTGDVTEADLYALHKYAVATVVPTLFEGGFPWQGLEALFMDTPAIMSKIPVVVERLKSLGLDPDCCGLKLFDPENPQDLSDIINAVLKDRQKAVADQSVVKERLLAYNWDDVSRQYHNIIRKTLSYN